MSDIFDEIKKISPQDLESAGILRKAKRSGYICKCGNGTGDDGDGLSVQEYNWGYNYHCFGECGQNYTAVDLIGEHIGTTSNAEIAEWAKEKFSWLSDSDSDSATFTEKRKVAPLMKEHKAEKIIADVQQKDYSEFYQKTQNQLEEFIKSQGGKFRGLSLEDLQAVGAGIATAADLKAVGENIPASAKCLILPYNNGRFFMRSINDNLKVKRGNKGGKKITMYNPYKVEDFEKPFFVVEGEIDALSICAAGYPAVALSGAGEYKTLIKSLADVKDKSKVRIIMLLDNDSAGQKNAERAIEKLKAAGIAAVNFILSKDYDANKYLQIDSDGLKARLTEIYRQANIEFEQMEREKMKAAGIEILADVFDEIDEMSDKLKEKVLKWGFPALDNKLPMLPGCYLLGALPSLGKTTFALNVAGNICEQGEKVLYISYEPTAKQIAVKDLAGYWFKKVWNNHRDNRSTDDVPTASQIMLGKYNEFFDAEEMQKVREELKAKRRNFYFLQGTKETAQDLISKIQKFVDSGIKFIVVDYLQLIKGSDTKTMREQVDETVRELQMFQSKNNLVILFISSFNRENYRNYACLESFKESGGLEYSADAILALQLEYATGESRQQQELFQKKKESQPRNMELVILKNRFGIDFVDRFAYHSAHEIFIEKIESKKNDKVSADEIDEE